MSTKINARSPIFLNYAEPTPDAPLFICETALGDNFCVEISQRGIITLDVPDFGFIVSYTSSDSGFSGGKYADVSSDTTRTVNIKIAIPQGFSNSTDVFLVCPVPAVQPAFVAGTTCTSRAVPNGSMTNVSIAKNGASSTAQSTASKFTLNGDTITGFTFSQDNESLFSVSTTAASGTDINIIITSNTICGTGFLRVIPTVANSTSCQTFQQIQVSVTGCGTFACTDAPLQGGAISPAGAFTSFPTSAAFITTSNNISNEADGTPIITSVAANNDGAPRNIDLYYKLTILPGFTNAGGDKWCLHRIIQQSTGDLPAFTYADASHYDFGVSQNGTINPGRVALGSIDSLDPVGITGLRFPSVQTDTSRQVDFIIKSPNSGTIYSNPNANLAAQRVSMVQPANNTPCANATNNMFISQGFNYGLTNGYLTVFGLCGAAYSIANPIKASATFAQVTAGTTICDPSGNIKPGNGGAYVINDQAVVVGAGIGAGLYYIVLIDANGKITNKSPFYCNGSLAYGNIV